MKPTTMMKLLTPAAFLMTVGLCCQARVSGQTAEHAPPLSPPAHKLPAESPPTRGAIDRAIRQFEETGLDAIRTTLRGGAASAPLLRRILARDDLSTSARSLIDRALALCVADGKVSNGMKVGIECSGASLRAGEVVNLSVTLCNVSDHPVRLQAGMSYSDNLFGNGSRIQLVSGDTVLSAQFCFGFCGTGATALEVQLEPLSYRRFEIPVRFGDVGPIGSPDTERSLAFGNFTRIALTAEVAPGEEAGDSIRLRMHHVIATARRAANAKTPFWRGELTSKEIELQIFAPKFAPPKFVPPK